MRRPPDLLVPVPVLRRLRARSPTQERLPVRNGGTSTPVARSRSAAHKDTVHKTLKLFAYKLPVLACPFHIEARSDTISGPLSGPFVDAFESVQDFGCGLLNEVERCGKRRS